MIEDSNDHSFSARVLNYKKCTVSRQSIVEKNKTQNWNERVSFVFLLSILYYLPLILFFFLQFNLNVYAWNRDLETYQTVNNI
jgi:hypothetical protein